MTEEKTIQVENRFCTIVISDEAEALLAAAAAGRASVGLWRPGGEDLPGTAYLAEPEAAGDPVFLERVARRVLGLPWVIAQTDRLRIREFTEQDWRQVPADECLEEADQVFCRPELLRAYIRSQYRFYEYGIWAVEERDTGRLAGKAGVTNPQGIPEGETAVLELGYHIVRPYRRRGFGTEACRAIEAYVREEMPCRVCAKIDASNEASIRTALSCGLQFTGQIYSEAGRRMCLYAGNWTAR